MKQANFEIFTLHRFTSIITSQIDTVKRENILSIGYIYMNLTKNLHNMYGLKPVTISPSSKLIFSR